MWNDKNKNTHLQYIYKSVGSCYNIWTCSFDIVLTFHTMNVPNWAFI